MRRASSASISGAASTAVTLAPRRSSSGGPDARACRQLDDVAAVEVELAEPRSDHLDLLAPGRSRRRATVEATCPLEPAVVLRRTRSVVGELLVEDAGVDWRRQSCG